MKFTITPVLLTTIVQREDGGLLMPGELEEQRTQLQIPHHLCKRDRPHYHQNSQSHQADTNSHQNSTYTMKNKNRKFKAG